MWARFFDAVFECFLNRRRKSCFGKPIKKHKKKILNNGKNIHNTGNIFDIKKLQNRRVNPFQPCLNAVISITFGLFQPFLHIHWEKNYLLTCVYVLSFIWGLKACSNSLLNLCLCCGIHYNCRKNLKYPLWWFGIFWETLFPEVKP